MASLVSVIVPVYNRAAMLAEAVASVVAQTYRPLEIIIVNDGSTDDTGEVIDELAKRHTDLIRVRHQDVNRGPGVAREAGRRIARGDYIQYLDSDDGFYPGKLEAQVAMMEHAKGLELTWVRTCRVRQKVGQPTGQYHGVTERPNDLRSALLYGTLWATSAPLYRRTLLDRVGPWSALRQHEDWEYDHRVAWEVREYDYLDETLCWVREIKGGSLSSQWQRRDDHLADRGRAYESIGSLVLEGIGQYEPGALGHFERSLFFMGRSCHARGLAGIGNRLVQMAMMIARCSGRRTWEYRGYLWLSRCMGEQRTAVVAQRWKGGAAPKACDHGRDA